jgi:tRNA A-37 threonylcarbamoyl transferase component Bud32
MREAGTETVDPQSTRSAELRALLSPGTLIADRYEVVCVLGSGGSADVYRVRDRLLAREAALKILRPDRATEAALTRLRREVAIAQRVQSASLVRVYDIGESRFGPFITMEVIEGQSLRSRLQSGPLSVGEALCIARGVLGALTVLHENGILHRDVKPGNVLIESNGNVRLVDFGLARDFSPDELRATQTDAIVGTAEYLSPEQVLGKPVDVRSDLYATGVMLYECLAGVLPFRSPSALGTMLARVRERPVGLRRIQRDVPAWLGRMVDRLLEREPDDRFASAVQVIRALDRRVVPMGRRTIRLAGLAFAVIILLAGAQWFNEIRRQRQFQGMVSNGAWSSQAVDGSGRVLWSHEALQYNTAAPVTFGGRRYVAAVPGRNPRPDSTAIRLSFLDTQDGTELDSLVLPSARQYFPQYADEFGVGLVTAVDLNHDGDDEIVVDVHHTYWPSYTVLVDPIRRLARVIFVGSGHHRLLTTADVNGDGREEIILGGTNNRMGFSAAVVAIDALQTLATQYDRSSHCASSPDADYFVSPREVLRWYTLLPPGWLVGDGARRDVQARTIEILYQDGRTFRVGFDGFLSTDRRGLAPSERQSMRVRAYASLVKAERLMAGGLFDEAFADWTAAHDSIIASGDTLLEQWSRRKRIHLLIRAGRYADANREAEPLVISSVASDVAFEIAKELHLRGQLIQATHWYKKGMLAGSDANVGRTRSEHLEGAVLALAQLGRWADAHQVVETFCVAYPAACDRNRRLMNSYVDWREGKPPLFIDGEALQTDMCRYVELEFRHAQGEQPGQLLPRVTSGVRRGDTTKGLLQSLEAELLLRSGRHDEALSAARDAYDWVTDKRRDDTLAYALHDLVLARLRRIESATSNRSRG